MQKAPEREYKTHSAELYTDLGVPFTVTIDYYPIKNDQPSIESYELEGINISREELVEMFGKEQIHSLEVDLE